MNRSTTSDGVRVAPTRGNGRLARRGPTLLFVPEAVVSQRGTEVDDLFERFDRIGPSAANYTEVPRCVIDWSRTDGHVAFDSDIDLWVASPAAPITLQRWLPGSDHAPDARLTIVSESTIAVDHTPTALRDGDIHAGGFGLVFGARPATLSWATPASPRTKTTAIDITAEPSTPREPIDLDETLAPHGPVSYPADDTQRTFKRPPDARFARALRLPDGSVIPIDRPIIVGRAPTAAAARVDDDCRLLTIDGPATVSRTHVVIQQQPHGVTVTDCDARGRTALVSTNASTPVALTPWVPRTVAIGDAIQLGGPTALTIVGHARNSVDATEPPLERSETT